jgi:hypothetical protein
MNLIISCDFFLSWKLENEKKKKKKKNKACRDMESEHYNISNYNDESKLMKSKTQ